MREKKNGSANGTRPNEAQRKLELENQKRERI
jgi:hypothetical protein